MGYFVEVITTVMSVTKGLGLPHPSLLQNLPIRTDSPRMPSSTALNLNVATKGENV